MYLLPRERVCWPLRSMKEGFANLGGVRDRHTEKSGENMLTDTQRTVGEVSEVRRLEGLRFHDMYTKFHTNRFRH
jgi:hypothetical protein